MYETDESEESVVSSDAVDTVDYKQDEVVWVKLGTCWWPAEVQEPDNVSDDILPPSKEPPYAIVKFFNEEKYEFIKKSSHITKYLCERKNEFIRRGLDMHRSKNMFMETFPDDVSMAELKTDGDPDIITSDMFLPENRKSVTKMEKPRNRRSRKTSKKKVKRKIGTLKASTLKISSQPLTIGQYKCDLCFYSTDRVDNIVFHMKYHLGSADNILKARSEWTKRWNKLSTQSNGRLVRSLPIQSTSGLLSLENDIFGVRSQSAKKSRSNTSKRRSKLLKSETIKVQGPLVEDLLKEWGDDDEMIPNESDDSFTDTDSCMDMKMDSCIKTDHVNDEESEEEKDSNNEDDVGVNFDSVSNVYKSEDIDVSDTVKIEDNEQEITSETDIENTEIKDDNEHLEIDNKVTPVNYDRSSGEESTSSIKPRLRTSKRPLNIDELSKSVEENCSKNDQVVIKETSPILFTPEPRLRTSRRVTKQNVEVVKEEDDEKTIKELDTPKLRSSKRLSLLSPFEEEDVLSVTVSETPKLRTSKRIRKIDNEEIPKVEEYEKEADSKTQKNEDDKHLTGTKSRVSKRLCKSPEDVIKETNRLLEEIINDDETDHSESVKSISESKLKTSKRIRKSSFSNDEHNREKESKFDDSHVVDNSKNVTNEKFKIVPTTKLRSSKIHCSTSYFDIPTVVDVPEVVDKIEKEDDILEAEVETSIDNFTKYQEDTDNKMDLFVLSDNGNVVKDGEAKQGSIQDAKTQFLEEKSSKAVFTETSFAIEEKKDSDDNKMEICSTELKTFDEKCSDKEIDIENSRADELIVSDVKSIIEEAESSMNDVETTPNVVDEENFVRRTSKRTIKKRVFDDAVSDNSETDENSAKKIKKNKTLSTKKKVGRRSARKIQNENESTESSEVVENEEVEDLPEIKSVVDDIKEQAEIINQTVDFNQELETVTNEDVTVTENESIGDNLKAKNFDSVKKDENSTDKQSEIIDKTEISSNSKSKGTKKRLGLSSLVTEIEEMSDESKVDKFNFSMDYTEEESSVKSTPTIESIDKSTPTIESSDRLTPTIESSDKSSLITELDDKSVLIPESVDKSTSTTESDDKSTPILESIDKSNPTTESSDKSVMIPEPSEIIKAESETKEPSLQSELVTNILTESEKGGKLKLIEYKIITAAGNIVDAKSYDFSAVEESGEMLDINSMPIVVTDDKAVTPKSIKASSSKVSITSTPVTASTTVMTPQTPLTFLPSVSVTTTSTKFNVTTTSMTMKTMSPSSTVVKNLNPSRIPVPSYKTLHAAQKLPKIYKDFGNKNSNKTVLLTQPGKPGQFVIVPSTTSSTTTGTKYTVGKNRQTAQQHNNQVNQSQPTQILTTNATTLMFLTGSAPNQFIVKSGQNNISSSPTLITENGKIVALQNATLKPASLNQKTLVVRNVLKGQQQSHLVQTMPTSAIIKQRFVQQPVTYQQAQSQRIVKNTVGTTTSNSNAVVSQKQQLKKVKKPVPATTTSKIEDKKQSLQYVVHDYMGNKIVLHEGQIIAYPSEMKVDDQPAFYIFKVENCNLVPLSDEVMKSMEDEIKSSVPGKILSSNQIVKMPKVIKEVVPDKRTQSQQQQQLQSQPQQKSQRTTIPTNSAISYNSNETVDTMIVDEPILITDDGKKLIYTENGYVEASDDMDLSSFLMRTKECVVETINTASVPLIEEEIVLDNNHYFMMENNNVGNTEQIPSTSITVDQKHDILAAALADSDMLFTTSTVIDSNNMSTNTSSTITSPIMATGISSDYIPNKELTSITTEVFEANEAMVVEDNSKDLATISMPSLTDDAQNITIDN